MASGIFQKVSAVPKMANVANNITRSPDHILICSYKSIFWGDTFKGRIKNHIKPIRLLNMVCGGVIWQDKPTAACLRVRIKNRYSCSHPHSVLKAHMCFYVILTEWFCIYNTYVHNTGGVSRMSIDYKDIGQRIKRLRMEKGLTQERLSEIIGVGPSHMSHIESGSTVPSLEVFISILNALDCSADELLCRETNAGKPLLNSWLSEIIADCDPTETKILSDIVISAKETLRRNKISE